VSALHLLTLTQWYAKGPNPQLVSRQQGEGSKWCVARLLTVEAIVCHITSAAINIISACRVKSERY